MDNQFLTILIPLITGHILADFALQTDADVYQKDKMGVLAKHGLRVGATSYVLLGIPGAWGLVLGVVVSHLLIDLWKLRWERGTELWRFMVDQCVHILVIFLFSWAASEARFQFATSWWGAILGIGYYRALTLLSGILVTLSMGSYVVEHVFLTLTESSVRNASSRPDAARKLQEGAGFSMGLPDGGEVIGYLERGLILFFVLVGHPAGIGFLVAAKSVFRFGELTDLQRRRQAEYIIIGTLTSILFGSITSYLTALTLQALQVPVPLINLGK